MAATVWLLDLGNGRLKLAAGRPGGAFRGYAARPLPDGDPAWAELGEWLAGHIGDGAALQLCSSNPAALARLRELPAIAASRLQIAGQGGWPMDVRSKGTGADRVVAAYGAWRMHRSALLLADLGSAWTLDAVDARGVFLGGAIGAGLGVQEAALRHAAPHLAPPASGGWDGVPGTTGEAVACGTRGALAAALEGLARAFEAHLGGAARRMVSGGDGERMAGLLGSQWEHVDELVLRGLSWLAEDRLS